MLAIKRSESVALEVDLTTAHYVCILKLKKVEPTLALNPRGGVTRNPKQGYQWHHNRTCVRVHQNIYKKKKKKRKINHDVLLPGVVWIVILDES